MFPTSAWPFSDVALGAWLGLGFGFCLYNFFVGLVLKQRWLYSIIAPGSAFLFVEWMFFTELSNLAANLGVGRATALSVLGAITSAMTILSASLFTRLFLRLPHRAPHINRNLKVIAWLACAGALPVAIMDPRLFAPSYYGLLVVCALIASHAHICIWKLGGVNDRLIGASWILMGPAFLAWLGRNLGVFENTAALTTIYLTGFLGNLIILSLSSVYALKDANKRAISSFKKAQHQNIKARQLEHRLRHDLSEREKSLSAQKALIENESANQRALLSLISHDIRGPLAHARQAVSRVIHNPATMLVPTSKTLLDYTEDALQQTVETLDRLVDLNRLRDKSRVLQYELIDPHTVFTTHLSRFASIADKNTIQLTNKAHRGRRVYVDLPLLYTLLESLIANAIRHTKPGGVVTLTDSLDWTDHYSISIKNSVDTTSVKGNFKRIQAILTSHSTQQPSSKNLDSSESLPILGSGRGAGLMLTQALVATYHGSLSCRSESDSITFTLTLPTPKSLVVLAGLPEALNKEVHSYSSNQCSLLTAESAREVVDLALSNTVTHVVLYVSTNNDQVLDAIEDLREYESLSSVQIWFYVASASDRDRLRRQALRAGGDFELSKFDNVSGLLHELGIGIQPLNNQPNYTS